MSVSADIKKMFQDLIVPELTGIKAAQEQTNVEMKSLRNEMKTEIQRLDEKVGSVRNEVGSVRNEISSFRGEFKSEIKRLDEKLETAIQVRERLVALESKMSVLGH